MTSKIAILSEFLLQTDTQIRIFDLGRRVSKIALSDFQKFERGEISYPFPYEQTAWVGLLYWNKKDKNQHNIWFIRMPLDETGCIQLSARDEFMHLLLSRFQETMQKGENAKTLQHVLKDNPYVFKPTEDKMAVFHSKALQVLQQSPTQFFTDALNYIQGDDYQQWQHLGIQGITDLAVRQDQEEIHQALVKTLAKVPEQVFNVLCQNLENETIDIDLAKIIATRIQESNNEQIISNGIRALAMCQSTQFKNDIIYSVLEKIAPDQAIVLVAIAAKTWEVLSDEKILNLFLEKLSCSNAGPELFNSLMQDLMFMPGLREKILLEFRNPNRSENLSKAVGTFFQVVPVEL